MSESEGFLSRWSRRKRAAVTMPSPDTARDLSPESARDLSSDTARELSQDLAPQTSVAPPPAAALPEFDPASLPPIESLTADSDITAFLRPQVPAALRTAALRRAWTLDPAIRDYIGPADYAWDYNAPDGMAGFSLELGGDVKRLLAQAIGLVEEKEEAKPPAAPDEAEVAEPPAETPPVLIAEASEPPPPLAVAEPEPAPPPRRHGGARPV